jgi:hypothetical protein
VPEKRTKVHDMKSIVHSHPSHLLFPFICRDRLVDFSTHMTPLEEADANIAVLMEELRCVQQKLADARARRNALVPACKLPDELLAHVFALLKDPAKNDAASADEYEAALWLPAPDATLEWISVMAVCRHFRDVGLSEPRLWAALDLAWHPEMIQKHMDYNGEHPLDVKLYETTTESRPAALHFLQRYAPRVRYLDIDSETGMDGCFIQYQNMTQLRIFQYAGQVFDCIWLDGVATSLTSLELHGLEVDSESSDGFSNLPSLVHLILRGIEGRHAASFLFDCLCYTPALKLLIFEALDANALQPTHIPTLPHLCEIEIYALDLCAAALIQSLPEPTSRISIELYGFSENTMTPLQLAALEVIFTHLTAFWNHKTGHAHLPFGQVWNDRSSYLDTKLTFNASEDTPSGTIHVWFECCLSWNQPYPFLQSQIESLHLEGVDSSQILYQPIMACLCSLRSINIKISGDAFVTRRDSQGLLTNGPESQSVEAWIVRHGHSIEQIDFKNCSEEWRSMGTDLQELRPGVRMSWTDEAEDDAI